MLTIRLVLLSAFVTVSLSSVCLGAPMHTSPSEKYSFRSAEVSMTIGSYWVPFAVPGQTGIPSKFMVLRRYTRQLDVAVPHETAPENQYSVYIPCAGPYASSGGTHFTRQKVGLAQVEIFQVSLLDPIDFSTAETLHQAFTYRPGDYFWVDGSRLKFDIVNPLDNYVGEQVALILEVNLTGRVLSVAVRHQRTPDKVDDLSYVCSPTFCYRKARAHTENLRSMGTMEDDYTVKWLLYNFGLVALFL